MADIPFFNFAAFYYTELLEALLDYKREHVPELTDESEQEPLIQVLRMIAVSGHLSNSLIDQIGNETLLPTAVLPESVKSQLELIGYLLASATPATADIVYELAQVLSLEQTVVPEGALVATTSPDERTFEALEELSVLPTNRLDYFFGVEDGTATDYTAEANSATPFDPWVDVEGGSALREGDSVVLGHRQAMPVVVRFTLSQLSRIAIGAWEYWDGNYFKARPDNVQFIGGELVLDLNSYLGDTELSGTPIRVTFSSGAFEDVFSEWDGSTNQVKTGLLGQTVPSTDSSSYVVGSPWERFSNLVDDTELLNVLGTHDVGYSLPQTVTENWVAAKHFDSAEPFYALRLRAVFAPLPTTPTIDELRIDAGKQYVKHQSTQGRRQLDSPLGSSDGLPNQQFTGSKQFPIRGSTSVTVDGLEWLEVRSFLQSRSTDRHYRLDTDPDNRPVFIFGDGVAGAVPDVGVGNISAEYRYDAELNGNVGAGTITTDKSGLALAANLFNPRSAFGWAPPEGSTPASLEQAKINGPASLRTGDVALSPDDIESLITRASQIEEGLPAITRAIAIEEGFGPKTILVAVVLAGAELAPQETLDDLSRFLNGDRFSQPKEPKRIIANQEATAVNFIERVVDVTASVRGTDLEPEQIANALDALLQPEARKEDETFEWQLGGDEITTSRLIHEIFTVSDDPTVEVIITTPASNIQLGAIELPKAGDIDITVL